MTPGDFKAIFPAFTSVPVEQVQAVIDSCTLPGGVYTYVLDPSQLGGRYQEALANLVAHLLVMSALEGSRDGTRAWANDVMSRENEKETVVREPKLLRQQAFEPLLRTTYGQRVVNLRREAGRGGIAA